MFHDPPIVCHHDFAKCTLPIQEFPTNVSFVQPPAPTAWGTFGLVEAVLRAIKQMYDAPANPDWFVLLSEFDYPIKPAATIIRQLQKSPHDAHIQHQLIQFNEGATPLLRAVLYQDMVLPVSDEASPSYAPGASFETSAPHSAFPAIHRSLPMLCWGTLVLREPPRC